MPKLPAFPADGWRLGQPDLILEMPAGFDLPASGPDVFRNFVIPTQAHRGQMGARDRVPSERSKSRPSRAVCAGGRRKPGGTGRRRWTAGIRRHGGGRRGGQIEGPREALVDGRSARRRGCSRTASRLRLPKDSDFLLQMHFHLSGKPETEKSLIGIFFADKAPGKGSVLGRAAGAFRRRGRHRHSARREAISPFSDSFTLPGDVQRLLGDGARALPGQGDEGDGDAARRLHEAVDLDQRLGFQLAGQLRVQGAVHAAQGHAPRRHADLRQLRRQSPQSDQPAEARPVGRAVLRRNGDRRLWVRGVEQGGCPVIPAGACGAHEGGDCRRRQGWHRRPFSGVATAAEAAACSSSPSSTARGPS